LNYIDIIIVAIFLIGFILGYKDGMIRKLIGLAGLLIAIYLSITLASSLGRAIESVFGIEFYLAELIGGVLIFLTIILVFSILKRLVHPHDKVNNFINQLLGGIVGALQILFFLSAFFYLLNVFGFPDKKDSRSSLLYSQVFRIVPATVDLVGGYADSKQIIKEYINDKDSLK
jgi:membrane protein required for colicin V production